MLVGQKDIDAAAWGNVLVLVFLVLLTLMNRSTTTSDPTAKIHPVVIAYY